MILKKKSWENCIENRTTHWKLRKLIYNGKSNTTLVTQNHFIFSKHFTQLCFCIVTEQQYPYTIYDHHVVTHHRKIVISYNNPDLAPSKDHLIETHSVDVDQNAKTWSPKQIRRIRNLSNEPKSRDKQNSITQSINTLLNKSTRVESTDSKRVESNPMNSPSPTKWRNSIRKKGKFRPLELRMPISIASSTTYPDA